MIARYDHFAVNQKASISVCYVMKEFAHAFSYAYIELWMHLGSLELPLHIFRVLQTSRVHR